MTKFKVITAVHLFLVKNNRLLLARRFNTGYEDGKYSVIAGHVEEGETIKQAVAREAHEEANISIEDDQIEFVHVVYRKREKSSGSDRIDFFFKVVSWRGEPSIMEPDKCDKMEWFLIDEIPENTIAYIRHAIHQYSTDKKYSEYGWS